MLTLALSRLRSLLRTILFIVGSMLLVKEGFIQLLANLAQLEFMTAWSTSQSFAHTAVFDVGQLGGHASDRISLHSYDTNRLLLSLLEATSSVLPDEQDWPRYLGQAVLLNGELDSAASHFASGHDNEVISDFYLGLIHIMRGDTVRATQVWKKHPRIISYLLSDGRYLLGEPPQLDSAMVLFMLAAEAAPELCEPTYYQGLVWVGKGETETALEVWSDSRRYTCTDSDYQGEIFFSSGQLLAQQGRLEEATANLKLAVSQNDRDVKRLIALANVLSRTNRPEKHEEVYELYRRARVIDPDEIWAYVGVCNLERTINDFESALVWCQRATSLFPAQALGHFYLGLLYREMGDYVPAVESLETAVKLDAQFPGLQGQLSELYHLRED